MLSTTDSSGVDYKKSFLGFMKVEEVITGFGNIKLQFTSSNIIPSFPCVCHLQEHYCPHVEPIRKQIEWVSGSCSSPP